MVPTTLRGLAVGLVAIAGAVFGALYAALAVFG
jgi:hypothetical protein